MKVMSGDRIFIKTGLAAGEFAEVKWFDPDTRMFIVAMDGNDEPRFLAPKQFDVINIDMDYLLELEDTNTEDDT